MSYDDDYVPDYALIVRYAELLFEYLVRVAAERPGEPFTASQVTNSTFPLDRDDDVEMLLGALERINVVTVAGLDGQRMLIPGTRRALRKARNMTVALALAAARFMEA